MEWHLAYLALGTATGFLAGLFGVGGGLVLVPVLLLLFDAQHFSPDIALHLALGSAMATIVFTSIASARKHHQLGAVNWHVVWLMTPGILLGAAIGAWSTAYIPARGLGIFFAAFVYFAASQMLFEVRPKPTRQLPGRMGLGLAGLLTGWISSLVSIGGGTIIVPFLYWCNMPLRNTIGTSAAIGFPVALGGTVGYILTGMNAAQLPDGSLGYVYLPALFWAALGSVLTAPLGAKVTHRMNVNLLRKWFAVLLLVLATRLLLKVL
jgi:uncharacterized membrane protein YfcA